VLLVDDDEVVLRSLRRVLERAGHVVIARSTVHEAREVVCSHELDVVISDYWMADGTGAELATEVERVRPDARLLFLSGDHGSFHAGGVSVLQKPVRVADLLRALRN
jgi:two-component system, cell cycle sensor histidine kinase and response regulator CckA